MLMDAYDVAVDLTATDNFSDAGNTYYTNYLAYLVKAEIVGGSNNNLQPKDTANRAQMAEILFSLFR